MLIKIISKVKFEIQGYTINERMDIMCGDEICKDRKETHINWTDPNCDISVTGMPSGYEMHVNIVDLKESRVVNIIIDEIFYKEDGIGAHYSNGSNIHIIDPFIINDRKEKELGITIGNLNVENIAVCSIIDFKENCIICKIEDSISSNNTLLPIECSTTFKFIVTGEPAIKIESDDNLPKDIGFAEIHDGNNIQIFLIDKSKLKGFE